MPEVHQLLRQHGLQVTAQRLAIMRALSSRRHATADELADDVRGVIGSISRQAVYDTLGLLVDKNLIRRIQPAGSAARYEDRIGDNHHHLICRGCGAMFDIDCSVGSAPCLTADDDHGFEIDEAEVIYWGRCPTCLIETTSATSSAAESALQASTLQAPTLQAPTLQAPTLQAQKESSEEQQ